MHCFQVLQCAALKVKFLSECFACKTLFWVKSVQNWLLKLLTDGFLIQTTEVQSMEVSGSPKLSLLELLVINHLIREWHDAQIGFGRK